MKALTQAVVARHVCGGFRSFVHDHQPEAAQFPSIWWGPLILYVAEAQWCVIAGAHRLTHLHKPLILSHSGNGFETLLLKFPDLRIRYFPREWWPSAIKRGVRTLWPVLLRFEEAGARPRNPTFRCHQCTLLAEIHSQIA